MDGNKKQKFAASRRRKSGSSLYTKRRFQGNRYTKSAGTNENTSSNEQVDRYLSASYKKIKSSSNIVANPASINNNFPSSVAATEMRIQKCRK